MKILIPDAQFTGAPDIEAEVLGFSVEILVATPDRTNEIAAETWASADVIICYHHLQVDERLLDKAPLLRQIVRAGVGYDNVDARAAAARGIAVCNVPDYGTLEVADHAIALMLSLARGTACYAGSVFERGQAGWDYGVGRTVRRLREMTFAALGLGPIGLAAAMRAKAFGMKVVFHDPFVATGLEASLGIERVTSFEALVDNADVLNICAALTPQTRHLVNADALSRMAGGAFVINTSRGGIVDTSALLEAIRTGHIAGAGLDVLPDEDDIERDPLVAAWRAGDSALAGRVLVTPHAAWYSPSSTRDLRRKSAEVARDFLLQGTVRNCVNGVRPK
ncbi:C-terminal binding protein [Mesorhizobium sp. M3A.F.Ca.ET.201.01.1.1]|uniref:C-terminal binding protein n=1 Tax=Mesorhizobium sp. M3A.F.Ca.ET.201.01.1.1 TaxID=2563946 RepID=UPI001093A012|nr:C-terminal binding protein [Mesorhizobium sp. M3A.F.Ca.ET.201.01.1.1]TGS71752.1 C-terminal binding protein [Mesorhizobium sp. M3A.F.Ca.ET.201.01.1.1]